MTIGKALVISGDARALPLPDDSVDLIVTSPPYFALRSYTDGGEHYPGQIGSEETPGEWLVALLDCTREWKRVLKPSGSMFVDLGDKYSSHHGPKWGQGRDLDGRDRRRNQRGLPGAVPTRAPEQWGIPAKSLMLLPERYRIACVDELGLLARAVLVWWKPNALPESVTDRVRRSHEDWVHLTKQPRYFSSVDEIRVPHTTGANGATRHLRTNRRAAEAQRWGHRDDKNAGLPPQPGDNGAFHALGALPGSVWSIATEPLRVPERLAVDHFAAFPTEWPRRLILGWTPSGICVECGQGRVPVVDTDYDEQGRTTNGPRSKERRHESPGRDVRSVATHTISGYGCACDPPPAAANQTRRRTRPVRRHRHDRARRPGPRPHRDHRRPVRRLLPARTLADLRLGARPQGARTNDG